MMKPPCPFFDFVIYNEMCMSYYIGRLIKMHQLTFKVRQPFAIYFYEIIHVNLTCSSFVVSTCHERMMSLIIIKLSSCPNKRRSHEIEYLYFIGHVCSSFPYC